MKGIEQQIEEQRAKIADMEYALGNMRTERNRLGALPGTDRNMEDYEVQKERVAQMARRVASERATLVGLVRMRENA